MTNSFFNFTEAPDFGAILSQSYQPINEAFDRNEQLERENDRTREINAAMPMKMIKSLADFSITAKKAADKMAMDRWTENESAERPEEGTEEHKLWQERNEFLSEFEYENDKQKSEALKEKDPLKFDAHDSLAISTKKKKDIYYQDRLLGLPGKIQDAINNHLAGGGDPIKINSLINRVIANEKKGLISIGYSNKYLEFFGRKTFDRIKSGHLVTANEQAIAIRDRDVKLQQTKTLGIAVKQIDPVAALHTEAVKNSARFNGNIADGYRDTINGLVGLVKLRQVPYDVVETFLNSIVSPKGDVDKTLIDKLGGKEAANAQIQEWSDALSEARKAAYDAIATRDATDKTDYVTSIKDNLYKDGNIPTKEELIDYIYINPETKYDWSLGSLPAEVNKFLSAETQEDSILIPTLEKKAKLKTLTMEDVMKINNSSIRAQYASQVKQTGGGVSASGTYLKIGKQASNRIASSVTEETDGTKDRSIKWGNIQAQVDLMYPSVYAGYLETAQPQIKDGVVIKTAEQVAHGAAQADLLTRAQAGEFDTWGEFTSNTQAQLTAVEHIKTGGESTQEINEFLGTNIIVGTERALKQAQSFPEGSTQTALMYKQLGDKLGIPGHILQAKQLEAAAKLKQADLPIKSAITLAYEKMSDKEKKLLNKVTPARLARMKFEAFMNTPEGGEEGAITYDEMLALHPSVQKLSKETEELNQQATAVKDAQLKPKKGDWKPLPKGTYVQFDGKEWRQVGFTFGGQAYQGDVDEYIDKDLVKRQF